LPARLTLKSANVATPLAAVAVVVPPSVPPLELAARATVTFSAKPAATLPSVSKAVTWTGGVSTLSTMAPCGCAVNASWAASAGGVNSSRAGSGSDAPPSWSSLLISQLTSQLRARMPAPRRGHHALRRRIFTSNCSLQSPRPPHARHCLPSRGHRGVACAQRGTGLGRDRESLAVLLVQRPAGSVQHVPAARLVDAQVREVGIPVHHLDPAGAGQHGAGGVGREGDPHRAGEARVEAATGLRADADEWDHIARARRGR